MTSNETLEAAVAMIRANIAELRSTASRLEAQIGAVAAMAEKDFGRFSDRVEGRFTDIRQDLRDLRGEDRSLREKIDVGHRALNTRIETVDERLTAKIEATNKR